MATNNNATVLVDVDPRINRVLAMEKAFEAISGYLGRHGFTAEDASADWEKAWMRFDKEPAAALIDMERILARGNRLQIPLLETDLELAGKRIRQLWADYRKDFPQSIEAAVEAYNALDGKIPSNASAEAQIYSSMRKGEIALKAKREVEHMSGDQLRDAVKELRGLIKEVYGARDRLEVVKAEAIQAREALWAESRKRFVQGSVEEENTPSTEAVPETSLDAEFVLKVAQPDEPTLDLAGVVLPALPEVEITPEEQRKIDARRAEKKAKKVAAARRRDQSGKPTSDED